MTKIKEVKAPPEVTPGVEFTLFIVHDSTASAFARLSVEPREELELDKAQVTLPAAPGGGEAPVQVKIKRKAGSTTAEARILVRAGTTRSTFTRLTT